VEYSLYPFEKTYFGYSLNFGETFRLPKNFSAELSGWYNNTAFNGTQKVDGFAIFNAGIKKELINNRGSFQLSVADLFMKQRYHVYYGTVAEEAFSIKSNVMVNTESSKFPIIKLTYSRSFGRGIKNERKQASGSQDERERISQ
jgi:iron complex outermembrane recepter protein